MKKETFPIPAGCRAITMEIIDNKIVITFEPEFKRGDVLISTMGYICILDEIKNKNEAFEIVGVIKGEITYNNKSLYFGYTQNLRLATTEEAQPLWDALAKEGKRWNPETMQIEEIKKEMPRAKFSGVYYFIEFDTCSVCKAYEINHRFDDERHERDNYFLTEEQAQRAADKLKSALDEFWKEELK